MVNRGRIGPLGSAPSDRSIGWQLVVLHGRARAHGSGGARRGRLATAQLPLLVGRLGWPAAPGTGQRRRRQQL